jgi:hypothetical protein
MIAVRAALGQYVRSAGRDSPDLRFYVPNNRTAIVTERVTAPYIDAMPFSVDSLLTDTDWIPMSLKGQQESPTYYWEDGGLLKDAPVDFDATFAENMWVST